VPFSCRLSDAELAALPDFEFVNALLESIRDVCLYQQRLAALALESAFKAMSTVMSRLEVRGCTFCIKLLRCLA
jgi:hypothetical protein